MAASWLLRAQRSPAESGPASATFVDARPSSVHFSVFFVHALKRVRLRRDGDYE
jgi:hypothetical protein